MFISRKSLYKLLDDILRVTERFCIIETQKQFYEAKNGQILDYEFKDIVNYIESKEEFEIIDKKMYKEKLMVRRI